MSRLARFLSGAVLALAACDSPTTIAPLAPPTGALSADVGLEVGTMEVHTRYGGQPLHRFETGCLHPTIRLVDEETGATFGSFNSHHIECGRFTAEAVPAGSYALTVELGMDMPMMPPPIPVAGPIPVTIDPAATTSIVVDVDHVVGIVTGRVSINDGLPTQDDNVSGTVAGYFTSIAHNWSEGDRFHLLLPAGAGSGEVTRMMQGVIATFEFDVAAGEATDVGVLDIGLGAAAVQLTYHGSPLDPEVTGCVDAALRLTSEATGSSHSLSRGSGGSCGLATANGLAAGTYTLSVTIGMDMPGMPPPVALIEPMEITVIAGQTTTASADLAGAVGVLTGTVRINGEQPTSEYSVTATVAGNSSTTGHQWAPDGSFRLLLLAGEGSGQFVRMGVGVIGSFGFEITAGATTDIGMHELGTGAFEISLTYLGDPISNAQTGCLFPALRLVNQETGQAFTASVASHASCDVISVPQMLAGTYTLTVLLGMEMPFEPPPVVLAGPTTVEVVAGETTVFPLEVGGKVGMLTGHLTVNDEPPTHDYSIHVTVGAYGASFPGMLWEGGTQFRFLLPEGPGTGRVVHMMQGLLATFSFNVVAGDPVDIGNPLDPNSPPVLDAGGPYTVDEGSVLTLAWTATDQDGDPLHLTWDFGDGTVGEGSELPATHIYATDGSYTVTFTADDARGGVADETFTVAVLNVPPVVSAFAGATLLEGEAFSASGTFTDPGDDTWSATVDFGTGTGPAAIPLTGKAWSVAHTYLTAGEFLVTVAVADDAGGVGVATASVVVHTPAEALAALIARIDMHADTGDVSRGEATSLKAKLAAAAVQLQRGNTGAALNLIEAFVQELDALQRGRRIPGAIATELRVAALRIVDSIGRA